MGNREKGSKQIDGTLQVELCMGSSCFARGNREVVEELKQYIQENELQDTIDLKGNLCMEECEKGPNMKINGNIYNEINTIKAIDLINSHIDGE